MERAEPDSGITLAELLAAFSLATDLGLGQPMEHVLRSWQIATHLGSHMKIDEDQRESLFYVAMLAWVGCVADAPEVAAAFGDDIAFRADSYSVDLAGSAGFGFFLSHAGRGGSAARRLRAAATIVLTGGRQISQGLQAHCLTTSALTLTKEAVRVAISGTAVGIACEGCPPLADLIKRYEVAGGRSTRSAGTTSIGSSPTAPWARQPRTASPASVSLLFAADSRCAI